MNSTDALRDILHSHKTKCYDEDYGTMCIKTDSFVDVLSDLTALISEHYYPKEFLLWTHHQDYWHFDIITDMWYSADDPQLLHEITTDELLNYWKENEQ